MATIDINRTHALGTAEAKTRANGVLQRMEQIKGAWNGDTFNITAPAAGTCKVTETSIRIEIDLPFLMRPLKGTIEGKINRELEKALK